MPEAWVCFVCGREVRVGQRFTFVSKGPVHLDCLEGLAREGGVYSGDVERLFRALKTLLDNIVLFRELREAARGEAVKSLLHELQKSSEAGAAKVTKLIESNIEL